jgi:hypothetical protein
MGLRQSRVEPLPESYSLTQQPTKNMKKYQLVHQFGPNDRAKVREALIDLHQFASFHSLFKKVTRLATSKGQPAIYAIQERVKVLGFLPLRPWYNIEVTFDDENVVYNARIMGLMTLTIFFSFEVEAGNTQLIERIEITKIPLLTWILWDVFEPAHLTLFAKMRSEIENARQ